MVCLVGEGLDHGLKQRHGLKGMMFLYRQIPGLLLLDLFGGLCKDNWMGGVHILRGSRGPRSRLGGAGGDFVVYDERGRAG
jgi:hypothetical protein